MCFRLYTRNVRQPHSNHRTLSNHCNTERDQFQLYTLVRLYVCFWWCGNSVHVHVTCALRLARSRHIWPLNVYMRVHWPGRDEINAFSCCLFRFGQRYCWWLLWPSQGWLEGSKWSGNRGRQSTRGDIRTEGKTNRSISFGRRIWTTSRITTRMRRNTALC